MIGIDAAEGRPGIYLIRNMVTWREYVGSSNNVRKRLLHHRQALKAGKHVNPLLQRSWDKYGPEAFECRAVVYVDVNRLIEVEQQYIDMWGVTDRAFGFNIVPYADRRQLAPETLLRMSASLKGKNTGKSPTLEVRRRISDALTGRRLDVKAIEKRRATMAARTEEERQAIAQKLSAALTGKKKSPEARANMGAARKKFWAEWRARRALQTATPEGSTI